ncbi:MAG: hypothetical protein ACREBI_04285 [Nitrosotalea sp.]
MVPVGLDPPESVAWSETVPAPRAIVLALSEVVTVVGEVHDDAVSCTRPNRVPVLSKLALQNAVMSPPWLLSKVPALFTMPFW